MLDACASSAFPSVTVGSGGKPPLPPLLRLRRFAVRGEGRGNRRKSFLGTVEVEHVEEEEARGRQYPLGRRAGSTGAVSSRPKPVLDPPAGRGRANRNRRETRTRPQHGTHIHGLNLRRTHSTARRAPVVVGTRSVQADSLSSLPDVDTWEEIVRESLPFPRASLRSSRNTQSKQRSRVRLRYAVARGTVIKCLSYLLPAILRLVSSLSSHRISALLAWDFVAPVLPFVEADTGLSGAVAKQPVNDGVGVFVEVSNCVIQLRDGSVA